MDGSRMLSTCTTACHVQVAVHMRVGVRTEEQVFHRVQSIVDRARGPQRSPCVCGLDCWRRVNRAQAFASVALARNAHQRRT